MIKRLFDIIISFIGLLILLPFLLILGLFIVIDSPGGIFYRQIRIGKNENPFRIFKFRSMQAGSDKKGLLTVGNTDMRITKVGTFIRKYKLDEFAQLINVLNGDMSLVGPRPEVPKYVEMYTTEQKEVLKVKPGITDYASIEYSDENEILARAKNPESTYIEEIMPAKLILNRKYIENMGLKTDINIIWMTLKKVLGSRS
ncbi:MAG: sugar transferase [Bacteroidota bacterium]|nr:sugar transferase [Bacteroidota bacterium]